MGNFHRVLCFFGSHDLVTTRMPRAGHRLSIWDATWIYQDAQGRDVEYEPKTMHEISDPPCDKVCIRCGKYDQGYQWALDSVRYDQEQVALASERAAKRLAEALDLLKERKSGD